MKLVSEQLEAELLALTSASEPMAMFKSRSTIFTVEDDDRDAEKIVVDIIEKVFFSSLVGFSVLAGFSLLKERLNKNNSFFNIVLCDKEIFQ